MISTFASQALRPTILEIDLDAAAANMRAIRELVGPHRQIFAVVKADGYGYGAAEVGAVFLGHGADALAVADLSEGIRLRSAGIAAPILIYPNSLPEVAHEIVRHGLLPVLVDLASARAHANAAAEPCDVFVSIDVSYAGVGIPAEQAAKFIMDMLELPHLRLAGICAHGHTHGDDRPYVEWQLHRFTAVVDELEAGGVTVPIRLLAASPFVLRFPETYLNAVEPGRILYGITYAGEKSPVPLRQVFHSLSTRVIAIQKIKTPARFAELAPFPVMAPMRVGVIPLGSADGLKWLNAGRVLVQGRPVSIIGNPSLEHTRIDLTEVPEARIGDEIVIIGRQGDAEITVTEVVERHGLGLNQLATTIGPRVTRVYRNMRSDSAIQPE
jgi:alanine racemase